MPYQQYMPTYVQQQPMPQQPVQPQFNPQQPVTPDEMDQLRDQILAARQQAAKQAQNARQFKLADAMRADAGRQLQGVQAGRIFRAPGALNLVANVLGQYGAAQMDRSAEAQAKTLAQEDEERSRLYFDALRRRSAQGG